MQWEVPNHGPSTRQGLKHGLSGVVTQDTQAILEKRETELTVTINRLSDLLERMEKAFVRETSLEVLEEDTDTGSYLARGEGKRFDFVRSIGTVANSVLVQDDGGGTLQIRVNGSRWIPAAVADAFRNMRIKSIELRVTTAAAGTARVIVGYDAGVSK